MNTRLLFGLLWLMPTLCFGALSTTTSYFLNVEALTNVTARSAVRGLTGVFTNGLTAGASTFTKSVAYTPVTLTDAATVATDASQGVHFRVTLGGNRTLGNPTNPSDGQRMVWEVIQDATGVRTLAMDTKFAFGTDITGITLTTNATKRDFITAVYNSTADKFYVTGFVRGY